MNPTIHQPPIYPVIRRRAWKKWAYAAILTLILLSLLAALGLSYYVSYELSHPAKKPVKLDPGQIGLGFQNVTFKSRQGDVALKGWVIKADKPTHKWVITSHGYRQNRLIWPEDGKPAGRPGLDFFKFLHDSGYNILAFDYRNSGQSGGDTTTVGYDEQKDLLSAVDEVERLDPKAEVSLIGWSMGASTALAVAGEHPAVKAVIADSPFEDLGAYLKDNLSKWSGLPNFPFTPLILNVWVPIVTGVHADGFRPIEALAKFNGPILLIHSKADSKIPYADSQTIYDTYKDKKDIDLVTFARSDHTMAFVDEPETYEKAILDFFKRIKF
jgi:dipeptidyl aminopeptidase/acylaminoacyl peptidase